MALCLIPLIATAKDVSPKAAGGPDAIDVSGFHDSVHHWREIRDEGL